MGWLVMVLGVLQPVNAYFRPPPTKHGETKGKKRFLWEILHKCFGYCAVVLAIVTVFLGIALGYLPEEYETWFWAGFLLFVTLTFSRWLFASYSKVQRAGQLTLALCSQLTIGILISLLLAGYGIYHWAVVDSPFSG
jgi:hypothetical protein